MCVVLLCLAQLRTIAFLKHDTDTHNASIHMLSEIQCRISCFAPRRSEIINILNTRTPTVYLPNFHVYCNFCASIYMCIHNADTYVQYKCIILLAIAILLLA